MLDNIGVTSTTEQTEINGCMQIWNLIWVMAGVLLAAALVAYALAYFVLLRDPRQCSASHLLGHSRPARLQVSGVLGNC